MFFFLRSFFLIVFFFGASYASDPVPSFRFKIGFEFQENNHIFNQSDSEESVSATTASFLPSDVGRMKSVAPKLPPDEWLKKPLLEFLIDGEPIFHIEIDDLDLEIVTAPFSSDRPDIFRVAFGEIKKFIGILEAILMSSRGDMNLRNPSCV